MRRRWPRVSIGGRVAWEREWARMPPTPPHAWHLKGPRAECWVNAAWVWGGHRVELRRVHLLSVGTQTQPKFRLKIGPRGTERYTKYVTALGRGFCTSGQKQITMADERHSRVEVALRASWLHTTLRTDRMTACQSEPTPCFICMGSACIPHIRLIITVHNKTKRM